MKKKSKWKLFFKNYFTPSKSIKVSMMQGINGNKKNRKDYKRTGFKEKV